MQEMSRGMGPKPEQPSFRLFELTLRASPQAREVLAKVMGAVALEVFRRGGHLSIAADGPNQGITIEVDGLVRRFNPLAPPDSEDGALIDGATRRKEAGEPALTLRDPFDINLESLRVFTHSEASLRERLWGQK